MTDTPETIYLIPGEDVDGAPCMVWCDDPAPSYACDPAEAVKYIRADKHLGWNARASHGNCQGILDSSACEVSITPEMIEAGAQRLVAWEDGSVWPDSWDSMTVAAARNDSERVIRSALGATDHIADASEMVHGNVQAMGNLNFNDEDDYQNAVVIEFASHDELVGALESGQCKFSVFGGDA